MRREKARPRRWWQSWGPNAGLLLACNPLAFPLVALPSEPLWPRQTPLHENDSPPFKHVTPFFGLGGAWVTWEVGGGV